MFWYVCQATCLCHVNFASVVLSASKVVSPRQFLGPTTLKILGRESELSDNPLLSVLTDKDKYWMRMCKDAPHRSYTPYI